MNKEIKREFILIFMGLLWLSCEKKVAAPAMPPAPAPKPTLEVAIAMGKPYSFIPSVKYEKNSLSISGQYLSGTIATDPLYEDVKLVFYAKSTGKYLLSAKNYGYYEWGWHYEGTRGAFRTDSVFTGFITLTTFDSINHIASGNFNFAAGTVTGYPGPTADTCIGSFANITW